MPAHHPSTAPPSSIRARILRSIAVILIVLTMAVLTVVTARDLADLVYGTPKTSHRGRLFRPRGTRMELRIADIQPWMTFEYLVRVFRLDPIVFKQQLTITDRRYPRLSISGYAREKGIDSDTAIRDIQTAVRMLTATTTAP